MTEDNILEPLKEEDEISVKPIEIEDNVNKDIQPEFSRLKAQLVSLIIQEPKILEYVDKSILEKVNKMSYDEVCQYLQLATVFLEGESISELTLGAVKIIATIISRSFDDRKVVEEINNDESLFRHVRLIITSYSGYIPSIFKICFSFVKHIANVLSRKQIRLPTTPPISISDCREERGGENDTVNKDVD